MTINVSGALLTECKPISGNGVTTIYSATKRTTITSILVCPTSGTPNLSISRYDGTTSTRRYRRKNVAMTAGTEYEHTTPFVLDPGEVLEVTSSSATGDMDVEVTFINPDATAQMYRPTGGA